MTTSSPESNREEGQEPEALTGIVLDIYAAFIDGGVMNVGGNKAG